MTKLVSTLGLIFGSTFIAVAFAATPVSSSSGKPVTTGAGEQVTTTA